MTKHTYEYSVGRHPDYHKPESRFAFPKNIPLYQREWRRVATEIADDYHSNHDGWEANWPVELRIYQDAEYVWKGEVDREMEPSCYVI